MTAVVSTRQARKRGGNLLPGSRAAALLLMIALCPTLGSGEKRQNASAGTLTLPAGTVLHLHLQTAVSTKTSQPGEAITASLAREVEIQGGVAIPFGSTFKGTIEKCSQPAASAQAGASDQRAELLFNFAQVTIPGEGTLTLKGHVSGVTNARETMLPDGTIVGVVESEAPAASLLSGVLAKLGQIDPTVNEQIQKQKIGQVNTAIEFPAGTNLQFTLTGPLSLQGLMASAGPAQIPANLRAAVAQTLADAPQRAVSKDNRPGDPLNLVFVGTAQEIRQAFQQAGWTEPKKKNQKSIWKTAQAVINDDGYNAAPVSDLYLFGRREDLAFEKTLDTFNKRHHLRLWQSPASAPDGRPLWLAAATHDIGIDVHPGVISHATDPDLDDERAQVESDLFLGGNLQAAGLITPPNPLSKGMTATGGAWHTDGRLFVLALKSTTGSMM